MAAPQKTALYQLALRSAVRTTAAQAEKLVGEQAALYARYQGLLAARRKLNDDGPMGLRGAGAAARNADIELVRVHCPALPDLEVIHGITIDRSRLAIDGPAEILDGGILTSVGGRDHFIVPHFTGENPDDTTAVHDDFLVCPLNVSLRQMEERCTRLSARYRTALAGSTDPTTTLRQLLALSILLDMHLSPLGLDLAAAPLPIRSLQDLGQDGTLWIQPSVAARLTDLPRQAPWPLPAPVSKKEGSRYHAIAYARSDRQAWRAELRIDESKLYFARTMVAAVRSYGP